MQVVRTTCLVVVNVALWVLSAAPSVLFAQEVGGPPADARLRWGGLTLRPTVSIIAGIDTNVLNEETNPQQDFFSRTTPEVRGWLKAGRTQTEFRGGMGLVYFAEIENQNSVNLAGDGRFSVDLARFVPYVSAGIVRTRDRTDFEIDTRPLHVDASFRGGVISRLSTKVDFDVAAYRMTSDFAEEETFDGQNLAQSLNRTRTGGVAGFRYRLTPLTTLGLQFETEQDRFEFTPLRDSDSQRILPGVDFKPDALISGSAAVGVRRFKPLDPAVPEYTGLVSLVSLSYQWRGTTMFSFNNSRDVSYSFDPTTPYYLLTTWGVSINQWITDRIRVMGSVGRQRLDYQALQTASTAADARVDDGTTFGSSLLFFTPSRKTSFGITVDYARRSSGVATRQYDGVRAGMVVNYGL
jgi:hypothetical protein